VCIVFHRKSLPSQKTDALASDCGKLSLFLLYGSSCNPFTIATMPSQDIRVRVLGAGLDIGRSCLLLTLGHRNILLDCGAHPGFSKPQQRFPDMSLLPDHLDAVLITHFHLDHAGALPLLHTRVIQARTPVFMTGPTRDLARLMLHDFRETSIARNQYMPFSKEQVDEVIEATSLVPLGSRTSATGIDSVLRPERAPDVEISAWYAGHVLGAVMFRVAIAGVGSVVYSGDYSTASGRLLCAAETPSLALQPDLFISEATYCTTVRHASKSVLESELLNAVKDAIHAGGKILVPVGALGNAHEIIAVLSALWRRETLLHVPVYVTAGLLMRASSSYEDYARDWCSPGADQFLNNTKKDVPAPVGSSMRTDVMPENSPAVLEFNRARDWHLVTSEGPMVLFATPGSMSTGVSFDVFREWCHDARNVVVVPGFCFANTLAARLLTKAEGSTADVDRNIRCKLINMSFSAHADARGIVRTIRRLRPRAVMLVHGDESKIKAFQLHLRVALGGDITIYAPGNGDVVDIGQIDSCLVGKKRKRSLAQGLGEPCARNVVSTLSSCRESPLVSLAGTDETFRRLSVRYNLGWGPCENYVVEAGTANRPVCNGHACLSRLYANLLPDIEHVDQCVSHLLYKHCVDIKLDAAAHVIRMTWNHTTRASDAASVLAALDLAASPPSSPNELASEDD
jgi:integrator complex subunit 11